MDINKVLSHFKNVTQTSQKTWKAKCPAHKDDRPSLSITLQPHRILLHCHAGCSFEEVVTRAGVKRADLREGKQPTKNEVVAAYDYYSAKGKLLYQVCRTTGKGFFQRHLGPDHEWINNMKHVDRVLYRLPELAGARGARQVFVVEGEKDVDRLLSLGFLATCNSGGAGKWHSYYGEDLKGRHVVVIPDNDEPGKKHAIAIATALKAVAASVRLLSLSGLQEHGDVSDWLSAGGTAEKLKNLVARTPVMGEPQRESPSAISAYDLIHLELPPVDFIIPGTLPEGLTILAGHPKVGKSWLCLDLAIAVANGGYALGSIKVDPHDVLYLALEDNFRRLQSRLKILLGVDLPPNNLFFELKWPRLDDMSGGLTQLTAWIRLHPACRLIIIDTLARVKPVATRDQGAYDTDTAALAGLQRFTAENSVAVVLVHHTRKAISDDPLDAVSGTLALVGVADTTLILKRGTNRAAGELSITGRDVNEQRLALEWGGEDYPAWKLLGDADIYDNTQLQAQVIELLNNADGPMTPTQIAKELDEKLTNVSSRLARMIRGALIKTVARGQYTTQERENRSNTTKTETTLFHD